MKTRPGMCHLTNRHKGPCICPKCDADLVTCHSIRRRRDSEKQVLNACNVLCDCLNGQHATCCNRKVRCSLLTGHEKIGIPHMCEACRRSAMCEIVGSQDENAPYRGDDPVLQWVRPQIWVQEHRPQVRFGHQDVTEVMKNFKHKVVSGNLSDTRAAVIRRFRDFCVPERVPKEDFYARSEEWKKSYNGMAREEEAEVTKFWVPTHDGEGNLELRPSTEGSRTFAME